MQLYQLDLSSDRELLMQFQMLHDSINSCFIDVCLNRWVTCGRNRTGNSFCDTQVDYRLWPPWWDATCHSRSLAGFTFPTGARTRVIMWLVADKSASLTVERRASETVWGLLLVSWMKTCCTCAGTIFTFMVIVACCSATLTVLVGWFHCVQCVMTRRISTGPKVWLDKVLKKILCRFLKAQIKIEIKIPSKEITWKIVIKRKITDLTC